MSIKWTWLFLLNRLRYSVHFSWTTAAAIKIPSICLIIKSSIWKWIFIVAVAVAVGFCHCFNQSQCRCRDAGIFPPKWYSLRSLKTISSVSEPYLLMTVQLYVPKYLLGFSSMRNVDLMRSYSTSCRNENPTSLSVSIKMPLNAQLTCFAFGTEIAVQSISYVLLSMGCCWAREIIFGGPFSMTNASELISGKPLLCALQ